MLGGTAAVRAAGELAYAHLVREARVAAVSDAPSALASLGVLVGHYCDAPSSSASFPSFPSLSSLSSGAAAFFFSCCHASRSAGVSPNRGYRSYN